MVFFAFHLKLNEVAKAQAWLSMVLIAERDYRKGKQQCLFTTAWQAASLYAPHY